VTEGTATSLFCTDALGDGRIIENPNRLCGGRHIIEPPRATLRHQGA